MGIGDDGLAGLSPTVARLVADAQLLCGGARHLRLMAHPTAEQIEITADLEGLFRRIQPRLDRRVVVLASGDPCLFGIGPEIVRRFGRERVRIVPGVSSAALAFARLGESWHDAVVVSAHGRSLEAAVRQLSSASKAAVLTDLVNTPSAVATALLEAGAVDCAAWVFEHVGGPDERRFAGRLSDLAEGRTFGDLNVLVLIRDEPSEVDQRFGRIETAFGHQAGLVTKAEVRAISLSKLRLDSGGTLWDVGAGCGSLSIEAAGLMPEGRVFAIERSPEQLALLEENTRTFRRRAVVSIVAGAAPGALRELPDPTAVFVGGSGGAIEAILDLASERLVAGGPQEANGIA
ncbi:MAG: precorrin-6y C5,15-methyltransferase (decarboxylating) subunit CbiE, partial [Chloroflexi bacterium]|nr:precorrin-6y C5,15-methyltransferase (decarboxylating) subunit CbiE [Chloroflexota bacterium]